MTLVANRDERDPKVIVVRTTYGPITNEVREDEGHVRAFWGQLGRVLHTPEDRARAGYERYREHAGGVSKFTGDHLPGFDDQDEEVRAHWVAAFDE
jgi:hypothetical protein